MQIILASAKIMNVSIKREQSELVRFVEREKHGTKSNDKLKAVPDVSLSTPRFQNEAESFARDMTQYSAEAIAEMLGCAENGYAVLQATVKGYREEQTIVGTTKALAYSIHNMVVLKRNTRLKERLKEQSSS